MMAPLQTVERTEPRTVPTGAVVWINHRRANVATMNADGRVSTYQVNRGPKPEPSFLALVVRAIGDRERVMILGLGSARLALEREYVAIFRRPDRLVDVEPAGVIDAEMLVDRLRALTT